MHFTTAAFYRSFVLLIIVLIMGSALPVMAQETLPCEDRLIRARRMYEAGKLYRVLDTLAPCLERKGLRNTLRRDIFQLAAETNQFLDNGRKAQELMLEVYRIDPFYKMDISVKELNYLRNTITIYPLWNIQAYAGLNILSQPDIYQSIAFTPTSVGAESYQLNRDDPLGWTAGVMAGRSISNSRFDIQLGLEMSRFSWRYRGVYDNVPLPAGESNSGELSFREKHWWAHIPVLLQVNLKPKYRIVQERFVPYVYLGGSLEFLQNKTAELVDIQYDFPEPVGDALFLDVDTGDFRNTTNFSFLAGAGARFHFQRGFLQLDMRYRRMLGNLADERNRFESADFYYTDNDFRLNNVAISLGVGMYFFRAFPIK